MDIENGASASLWRRLMAGLYDSFLICAIWFAVGGIAVLLNSGDAPEGYFRQLLVLPLLFSTYLFYCWFWLHGGQTLGMRAWRIKLNSSNGKYLSVQQCSLRFFIGFVSLGASFIWILFNKKRLSIHDIVSNTFVSLTPKQP